MPLNEPQMDSLKAAAARDQAERLLAKMQETFAEAEADAAERTDLSEQQRAEGELAMRKAIESTKQMIQSLSEAIAVADQAAQQGTWGNDNK